MEIKNTKSIGKYWAVISDGLTVAVIPMHVPKDVDFDEYRSRAVATLELLGEVKAGEVLDDYGQSYFVQRPTHANRGKKPRPVKEYLMEQLRNV